jgi:predicted unusual protein kinase regulating ubiquinone biosynthesis (AarF/ABC1/UbiB family)
VQEDLERDMSGRFYVPEVHWGTTRKRVLVIARANVHLQSRQLLRPPTLTCDRVLTLNQTMEWIDGVRICDLSALETARFG